MTDFLKEQSCDAEPALSESEVPKQWEEMHRDTNRTLLNGRS